MSTINVNVAEAQASNVTVGEEGNLDAFLTKIGQELSVEELEVA